MNQRMDKTALIQCLFEKENIILVIFKEGNTKCLSSNRLDCDYWEDRSDLLRKFPGYRLAW